MSAGASSADPETLAPRFVVGGTAEPGKTDGSVRDILALLKNSPLEDNQALRAFLEDRKRELKVIYIDPYHTEYDYKLRSLGQDQRFLSATPTGFNSSSVSYKAFIDAAADNPAGDTALLERLRGLLGKALRRGNVIAGFTGSENDYSSFHTSVTSFLTELPEGNGKTSCEFLPAGWPSALIVSSGSMDSNHVMMSAQLHGEKDTATLKILGSVLSAKYILPELRDKYGAYGATCRFDESEMTFSCAGGVSVDDVVAVYQNTGNWLRGFSLTEQEMNGYRIGALREYDENTEWERKSAASLAMSGRKQEDFDCEREAILSVTLDDLKGCADLVDSLTAQGHVFAQVTKASEGSVRFPFAVRVDAESGRETVLLKDSIPVPDDATPLTRGETASLLADSLLVAGEAEQTSEARFSDVVPGGEQAGAIALLYDRHILHGYGNGTFRSGQPVSRAEFCSIASVLLRDVTADASPEFTDVPSTHWAHEVITNMAAQGILLGDGNGHFYPDRTVTRQEAETILNRLSAEQS